MALWGATDDSANAPKWTVASGLGASNTNAGIAMREGFAPLGANLYQNTTTSAWVTGIQIGVEGVNTVEIADTTLQNSNGAGYGKAAHTGWNLRKQGTGYISSISIGSAGRGYNANGYLAFTGGGGSGANASYVVSNNANAFSNSIISLSLAAPGSNYTSAPTATAIGSNITPATFTVTMGGRVGRVQFETLVALNNVA